MDTRPIGVFDSGIGGVSVLRNMVNLLPNERFIYLGDDANAPYGTRSEAEILSLALDDARFLLERDVKAIVIACNTATSAAAAHLRRSLALPIIGMEPALKPASLMRAGGAVCVLATPATLRLEKFKALMERYGEGAIPLPCAGLMEYCERGEISGSALDEYLDRVFRPLDGVSLDAVVLGCTHYVFMKRAIQSAARGAALVDGNEGTARQLRRVLESNGLLSGAGEGGVEMHASSGDAARVSLMWRFFGLPIE